MNINFISFIIPIFVNNKKFCHDQLDCPKHMFCQKFLNLSFGQCQNFPKKLIAIPILIKK